MILKEQAQEKIASLVNRFEEQKDFYKKTDYNETLTRRDFIDPFFKALGWDIDNENGYAESYRQVIHEDRVKVGKATKAPDYSFRLIGGKRLFFVEAKKPSVLIRDEVTPAYQVRRYGWSAKLPISVITDFEEFAVYDCTKKPNPTDKAATARIKYLTYADYINDFDFLWNTFSYERVLKGSFDKFVQSDSYKKGTATVDNEFLQSLDKWRIYLAKSISKNNKQLDEDEINFAVQQTIDRIIFLRIAEDRSIEPYGNLKGSLNSGNNYQNLYNLFVKADEKYNSGLFDFNKDKLSHKLDIDNSVIKSIINELYYPQCPYEFAVLPVEILGTAYEQFLGKQIKVDSSHRVSIEDKPAVRKSNGVYYTPQYIVDYVIENTLGKLIKNKTPKEISKIKIADPACGSGSFLIGAYQYLLNYHKDYYSNNGKISKGNKSNPLTPDGNLTTAEKKKILLNNIYGVDVDVNAVEVTKLSLLLKCMEGETEASIATQMKLFHERVLPTLDNNIKSGNSLIDTDYYNNQFDFGDNKTIKPFNWKKAFPQVYNESGFDVIIGNPPWVSLNGKFGNDILNPQAQQYLINKYQGNTYRPNLYEYFVHRGLELINGNGYFSFIVPDRLGFNEQFIALRNKILTNYKVEELIYKAHFPGIVTDTLIFKITHKKKADNNYKIAVGEFGKTLQIKTSKEYLADIEKKFGYETDDIAAKLLTKIFAIKQTKPLGEIIQSKTGVILDTKQVTQTKVNNKQIQIAKGRSIGKFAFIDNYFCEFSNKTIKGGTNDIRKLGVKEKVLLRKTGIPIIATYDDSGMYPEQSLYFLINNQTTNSLKYFTALINSKLFQFVYINKLVTNKDSTPQLKKVDLDKFPVFVCSKNEKAIHDEIVKNVDTLLQLNSSIKSVTLQTKEQQIQTRIEHSEERINELIYKLYNLTTTEIKIIENE